MQWLASNRGGLYGFATGQHDEEMKSNRIARSHGTSYCTRVRVVTGAPHALSAIMSEVKIVYLVALFLTCVLTLGCAPEVPPSPLATAPTPPTSAAEIKLPEPRLKSEVSLEEALLKRRSIREYSDSPLTLDEVSQLLWAGQGITANWGGRTAPSAGGLYPLEVYLAAGNVSNLNAGVYKYRPEGHELFKIRDDDVREQLAKASLNQRWVKEAAINIVIAAVYERTTQKYGDRGIRYVHMEAGHAAQNIYLQATALNLGTVSVGAFYEDQVKNIIGMPDEESPLYIVPVGRPAGP